MRLFLSIFFASASMLVSAQIPEFNPVGAYATGSASYSSVAYGTNTFVAVGDSNIVYSLDDGVNWVDARGYPKMKFLAIIYGSDRFVAVGEGSQSAVSFDGIRWTSYSLPKNTFRSLAYGNGLYVAAGNPSASSSDGASWSYSLPNAASVAYANETFLLNTQITGLPTTYNGIPYDGSSTPSTSALASFDNKFYIARRFSHYQKGVKDVIFFSSDGSTWEVDNREIIYPEVASTGRRLITGGSYFGSAFAESSDTLVVVGSSIWRVPPSLYTQGPYLNCAPLEVSLKAGASFGNTFVGVGATNKSGNLIPQIITSTNGLPSLTSITPPEGAAALNAIHHANGKFIAVGNAGTIIRSTDGLNWNRRLSNTSSDLYEITYANGLWVAVGANGKIVTSTDASVFGLRFSGTEVAINGITYGNGQYVAVGKDGLIVTSPNGIDWTASGTEEANTLNSVAYGNGLFVAVGANGFTHLSTDAVNWGALPIPNVANFRHIVYGHGTFLALTSTNNILYASTNGFEWISEQIPTFNLTGLNFSENEFWLTGEKSTILKTALIPDLDQTLAASLDPGKKLTLTLQPGRRFGNYLLESTPSLTAPNWQPLTTFSNVNSPVIWTETNLFLYRYYRARRQ